MALVPMCPGSTNLAYDDETHEWMIYTGDLSSGNYTVLGVAKQGITVNDYRGNRGLVAADGALKAADFGGIPLFGTDAAGADTYAPVVTASRECRYLHATVSTKGCIISIDGGLSDAFAIPLGTERLFPGLAIPAGSVVQAKNEVAGQNYANCHISIW